MTTQTFVPWFIRHFDLGETSDGIQLRCICCDYVARFTHHATEASLEEEALEHLKTRHPEAWREEALQR